METKIHNQICKICLIKDHCLFNNFFYSFSYSTGSLGDAVSVYDAKYQVCFCRLNLKTNKLNNMLEDWNLYSIGRFLHHYGYSDINDFTWEEIDGN